MSVDDLAFIYCNHCQRHTAHSTYWDASQPNQLDETCLECGRDYCLDRFCNLINWLLCDVNEHGISIREWVEDTFPEMPEWALSLSKVEAT